MCSVFLLVINVYSWFVQCRVDVTNIFGTIPKDELMTLLDNDDFKDNTVGQKYANVTK